MKVKNREKIDKKIGEFFGRVWGYAVWVLILVLAVSVVKNVKKAASIRGEVALEQAKVDKIKEENAKLEEEIAQTTSETFIEKQVRDKLGLVKEGEAIVVLPDEDTLRALAPQIPQDSDTLPDPNWKKWIQLFITK
jgi:cell division protein FtsB